MIESIFFELISKDNNTKNSIIGCIYKYLEQDTNEFTDDFINPLLHKVSTENEPALITGDFNINFYTFLHLTVIYLQE